MERVIFDTNFIITCLKEKIDFLDADEFGKITMPFEVLEELEKLSENMKKKASDRRIAFIALQIIQKNKKDIEVISLGKKFVDAGIVNYAKKSRETLIIASLDKELKRKLKEREFLSIKPGKKIIKL